MPEKPGLSARPSFYTLRYSTSLQVYSHRGGQINPCLKVDAGLKYPYHGLLAKQSKFIT